MPRVKAFNISKIKYVLHNFPGKFTQNPNNELYCSSCNCVVSLQQTFSYRWSSENVPTPKSVKQI